MSKTVSEYPLPDIMATDRAFNRFTLDLRKGAEIIHVGPKPTTQGVKDFVWVVEDPSSPVERRHFMFGRAGHRLPDEPLAHRGSYTVGILDLHVFERTGASATSASDFADHP
jgi:hypothetical protein